MKSVLVSVLVLFCLCSEAAESINLHDVANTWEKSKAPARIQQAMEVLTKNELAECIAYSPDLTNRQRLERRIFSAVKVDIGSDTNETLLVVSPSKCWDLRGVHAIRYWMVEVTATSKIRVLLDSSDDEIRFERSRTKGYRDVTTYYGTGSTCRYRFNGRTYRPLPPTLKDECL